MRRSTEREIIRVLLAAEKDTTAEDKQFAPMEHAPRAAGILFSSHTALCIHPRRPNLSFRRRRRADPGPTEYLGADRGIYSLLLVASHSLRDLADGAFSRVRNATPR
jgi:hypothetical protein